MAWYEVNYACGHSDRMQVYGPTAGRQRIADAEGRKDCLDCWRKKQDQRNADATLAASADAAASGLPALTGSDKQIAWAETIRQRMLSELPEIKIGMRQKAAAESMGIAASNPRWDAVLSAAIDAGRKLRMEPSAKWWIDHRDEQLSAVLNKRIGELATVLFGAEIQKQKDKIASDVAAKQAAIDAELQARRLDKSRDNAVGEAAAALFVPLRVERKGNDLRVLGDDNHVALGYREDGETVIYQIDEITIRSMGPAAEALNRRVAKMIGAA